MQIEVVWQNNNPYQANTPVGRVIGVTSTGIVALDTGDAKLKTLNPATLNMPVQVLSVPDNITYKRWAARHVDFLLLSAMNADATWQANIYEGLLDIATDRVKVAAIVQLLKSQNTASAFHQSLLTSAFIPWATQNKSNRQFKEPLSRKQWESLINDGHRSMAQKAQDFLSKSPIP